MLKDSKGLKITLLVIVLLVMIVNFLPGDTYSAKQEVVASVKDSYDLTIKAIAGDVTVLLDPTATEISASYSGSGRTRSKLNLSQSGSTVTISEKFSERGFFSFFNFTTTPRMMVVIPTDATLRGFTANTVSGDLSIESNMTADTIKLSSTSGDIDFLDLTATVGAIQINTVSGSIEGYSTTANKVKAASTSGDVEIYRIESNDIDLGSVSGDIYGEAAPGNGTMKLSTISGEIDMDLDAKTNATVNAKSLSGSIHLGVPGSQRFEKSATDTIGDGSGNIEAKTTSGSINISW